MRLSGEVSAIFILNKGAINEKLQPVSSAVNGRKNNIKKLKNEEDKWKIKD